MSSWKIRTAKDKDAEGLKQCMHKAYSEYAMRFAIGSLPPLEVDYAAEIANYPTWVAEMNGNIVGGLIMSFDDAGATLSNIAVDSDYQGQGLGRGLISFAENQAKEHGYPKLRLATHALLIENLAIYRHLGWKESDRKNNKVFFEKELF